LTDVKHTTILLRRVSDGDTDAANELLRVLYDELHGVAERCFRNQPADHTLQPTALISEAYLKLIDAQDRQWADRRHFVAVAARAMRQILIDHARAKGALKRKGSGRRVALESAPGIEPTMTLDVLALDEALRELSRVDPRQAQVVELRFFAGLSVQETAEALGVSDRTVEIDWRMARAWLSRALSDEEDLG
jgi:RNA polymerase sigma factor (TIGR02999 family)